MTGVLPWINEHAPRSGRVLPARGERATRSATTSATGCCARDLRPAGPLDADIAAYQYHQEFREHEFNVWQAFGTRTPATGLYLDETPQVVVYQRR